MTRLLFIVFVLFSYYQTIAIKQITLPCLPVDLPLSKRSAMPLWASCPSPCMAIALDFRKCSWWPLLTKGMHQLRASSSKLVRWVGLACSLEAIWSSYPGILMAQKGGSHECKSSNRQRFVQNYVTAVFPALRSFFGIIVLTLCS